MIIREVLRSVFGREDFLPNHVRDEIAFAEHLIHQQSEREDFVVANRHENHAVFAK